MTASLTLTRPDDWHVHLRDGAALAVTVPATARVFGRAIVMPNLVPAVTSVEEAEAYRGRILEHVPAGVDFDPLMVLYLAEGMTADVVQRAAESEHVVAVKLYPAGATTNSAAGVTQLERVYPTLEAMQSAGLPLLIHGEATDPAVDIFDRERIFLEQTLAPLVTRFDSLRVVLEHITTADAAKFVSEARPGIAATITPQHLLMNRNDLFAGGLQPHNYCLPVLKREVHQRALQGAALSGDERFFLGTDSAPHAQSAKERACGCAGCFSGSAGLSLYAQFFSDAGQLERLESFASHFGPDFYGLPRNRETVTLRRDSWVVPESLPYVDGEQIVPYWAGRSLDWTLALS
ncbi:MAG: dihydroorotase [Planctomycetota bacterium]|jgi:dihydroorotase